jgi:hypothetical protein
MSPIGAALTTSAGCLRRAARRGVDGGVFPGEPGDFPPVHARRPLVGAELGCCAGGGAPAGDGGPDGGSPGALDGTFASSGGCAGPAWARPVATRLPVIKIGTRTSVSTRAFQPVSRHEVTVASIASATSDARRQAEAVPCAASPAAARAARSAALSA